MWQINVYNLYIKVLIPELPAYYRENRLLNEDSLGTL
jgi:hypothetical protein